MNIKEAKEQIKNTVKSYLTKDELGRYIIPTHKQRPVFLIEPPGIGKTAIMEQVASEMGIALLSYSMTHHTRQSALGLPLIKHVNYFGEEYDVSEYTMSEIIYSIYETMQSSGIKNGILFLDEINCVSETLTPIMLQFLQYKVFGRHEVPAGWIVVTAGNPPEYNHSVHEFDIATWDRLKRIDVEPNFDVWKEFAYISGLHSSILTYLEIRKGNFYKVETTINGKSFVTARGWDDLSQMIYLYEMHKIPVNNSLISQYIQNKKIAQDFAIYYDLYNKYKSDYQIKDILNGTAGKEIENRAIKAKFDERYSLIGLLLDSVMSQMRESVNEDNMLHALMTAIKNFKSMLTKDKNTSPEEHLDTIIHETDTIYRNGMKAKSLSDTMQIQMARIIEILNQDKISILQNDGKKNPFDIVKSDFNNRVKVYSENADKLNKQISNMFRFCETVFPNGQELVILVTELTANPYSSLYISKHHCDEYFIHNQELMFHQRQQEIMYEIDALNLDE